MSKHHPGTFDLAHDESRKLDFDRLLKIADLIMCRRQPGIGTLLDHLKVPF